MPDRLADLIETIEREHTALVALIEAALADDLPPDAQAVAKRQSEMEPCMRRLGEATRQLAALAQTEPLPAALAEKIETWRRDLTALQNALDEQTLDVRDRRQLVVAALAKLRNAAQGFAGYRSARPKSARFIQKKA